MSATKRYLEDVSVSMGFDGEINDKVIREAEKRQTLPPEYLGYLNGFDGDKGSESFQRFNRCMNLGHKYAEKKEGNCYYLCTCKICNISWHVDSSG